MQDRIRHAFGALQLTNAVRAARSSQPVRLPSRAAAVYATPSHETLTRRDPSANALDYHQHDERAWRSGARPHASSGRRPQSAPVAPLRLKARLEWEAANHGVVLVRSMRITADKSRRGCCVA